MRIRIDHVAIAFSMLLVGAISSADERDNESTRVANPYVDYAACANLAVQRNHDLCRESIAALGVNNASFLQTIEMLRRTSRFEDLRTLFELALLVHPRDAGLKRELELTRSLASESRAYGNPVKIAEANTGAGTDLTETRKRALVRDTESVAVATTARLGTLSLGQKLLAAGLISADVVERQQRMLADQGRHEHKAEGTADTDVGRTNVGQRVALLIGNNDYDAFDSLSTAINDAKAVAELLEADFGYTVDVLLNATRSELITKLVYYRRILAPDDQFLVYYAGHGFLERATGRGYWLPVDAQPNNPSNWVSNVEVADAIQAVAAKRVLLVADSCFAGTLAGDTRRAGFGNATEPKNATAVGEERSWVVITSGGVEPVLDSGFGEHSIFARALLMHLGELNGGQSVGELFKRVHHTVTQHVDQEPQIASILEGSYDLGEFEFRKIGLNDRLSVDHANPLVLD